MTRISVRAPPLKLLTKVASETVRVWKWYCGVCVMRILTLELSITAWQQAAILKPFCFSHLRMPSSLRIQELQKTHLINSWEFALLEEVFFFFLFSCWRGGLIWLKSRYSYVNQCSLHILFWVHLLTQSAEVVWDRYPWNNLSILTTNGWVKGNCMYSTHQLNTEHF